MSVYTPINQIQLTQLLSHYSLGELIDFKGIEAGIENTNYRITTTTGRYILTIFELFSAKELPFFFELLQHFQRANIVCPHVQLNDKKQSFSFFESKVIAFFKCIVGESPLNPSQKNCAEIGLELGKIHGAGLNFFHRQIHPSHKKSLKITLARLTPQLNETEKALIQRYLKHKSPINQLPRGIIHGDLFKDNALFHQGRLSGVLDFYAACEGDLLLDLAITVNDWCVEKGQFQIEKMKVLLSAYQQQRLLEPCEKQSWPFILQKAAFMFWISRLEYAYYPPKSVLTFKKEPNIYKNILLKHLNYPILLVS
jgi:homoserine kinase type II